MVANPRTFKLTIAYDGTDFRGWQRLPGKGRSVQETLERALSRVFGVETEAIGAGRTDAGVHALGQVASVRAATAKELATILRDLNAVLPADIAVTALEEADPRFHARHLATAKTYRYRVLSSSVRSPLDRRYSHFVPDALDAEAMRRAADVLRGKHNFQSFTNLKEKGKSFEREIHSINVSENGSFVDMVFRGDGFLHNQVRIMASALIDAGLGKTDAAELRTILDARDRSRAPGAAPAAGLCLMSIEY